MTNLAITILIIVFGEIAIFALYAFWHERRARVELALELRRWKQSAQMRGKRLLEIDLAKEAELRRNL